jgi:hypothetical protein
MHIGIIIGLVLLPFVVLATNKQHRDETGVPQPSRKQFNNFYRTARRKGITVDQAYQEWLRRQQRKRR